MGKSNALWLGALGIAALALCPSSTRPAAAGPTPPVTGKSTQDAAQRARSAYANLPIGFEPNRGQAGAGTQYLARGNGYSVFLRGGEAVLLLNGAKGKPQGAKSNEQQAGARCAGAALRLQVVGGRAASPVALEPLRGKANYLRGRDRSRWIRNLPTYARVRYEKVYPGIDLDYYGNQRQLEYDFTVAPGASASTIRLALDGSRGLSLDAAGNLQVKLAGGDVTWLKPVAYQMMGGQRHSVSCRYVLEDDGPRTPADGPWTADGGGNRQLAVAGRSRVVRGPSAVVRGPSAVVAFRLGSYDRGQPLVIDPVLAYSSFLGGTGDDAVCSVDVDCAGSAYLAGFTTSTDFPTPGTPFQGTYQGGAKDAFVSKINPTGTALVYSTYLGGSGLDSGNAIRVQPDSVTGGPNNRAVVAGNTDSPDFPTTANAFQGSYNGGTDAFVTRLTADGSNVDYSTYLGGTGYDFADGVAVDPEGNIVAVGGTLSTDFPTVNPIQAHLKGTADAFVTKLDGVTGALVYSTYLGGSDRDQAYAVAEDVFGNAYVGGATSSRDFPTAHALQATNHGGFDGFVTKLSPDGLILEYSTYLGGAGDDWIYAIAVDSLGDAYATGRTFSSNFPTTPGAFQTTCGGGGDAFVTRLTPAGGGPVYSTYLGGSGEDFGRGIAVDSAGRAFVAGATASTGFPVTADAFQPTYGGGNFDAFLSELSPAGTSEVYSTYLGGSATDEATSVALDSIDNAYVGGATGFGTITTGAPNPFPTTDNAFQPNFGGGNQDGFIAKIGVTDTPVCAATCCPRVLGSGNVPSGITIIHHRHDPTFSFDVETSGPNCSTVTGHLDVHILPTTPGGAGSEFISDNVTSLEITQSGGTTIATFSGTGTLHFGSLSWTVPFTAVVSDTGAPGGQTFHILIGKSPTRYTLGGALMSGHITIEECMP